MLKNVVREKYLNRCKCDVDGLEALVEELTKHFPMGQIGFELKFNNPVEREQLYFENFRELREYDRLPNKLTKLEWSLYQPAGRRVDFQSISDLRVTSRSDSAAWCVGANEIVSAFCKRHRKLTLTLSGFLFPLVIAGLLLFALAITRMPTASVLVTTLAVVALAIAVVMTMWFEDWVPHFVLEVRKEEAWWRRYSIEIMLVLTAIPAMAVLYAFAQWVKGRLF